MTKENRGPKCVCCLVVTLAILGAGGYGIWYWLGQPELDEIDDAIRDKIDDIDFSDFTDVLGNLTDFVGGWTDDPWTGNSTIEKRWRSNGNGLDLTIQNALDENWFTEFESAVTSWDNGNPDALTLTTERVAIDYACSQKSGVMKVCNGNYGDTGWLGINEILSNTITDIVQSSVAKMNEYYLHNADYDERLYTMCHEIGHGFGLPHTDETFWNADLGDCLDYTNNPSNNLNPGKVNYQKLLDVYGPVGGRRNLKQRAVRWPQLSETDRHIYEQAMKDFERHLQQRRTHQNSRAGGWRALRTHARGGRYGKNLGNGYKLEVEVLHPFDRDGQE